MDYRLERNRYEGFMDFHVAGMRMDEIDPAKPALQYIARTLALNAEQKFWLAWLYGATYCVATAFYIFTQFPTLDSLSDAILDEWWKECKPRLVFTTDRHWVKANDLFPAMVRSYKVFTASVGQFGTFCKYLRRTPQETYDAVYGAVDGRLYYFSRFSIFTYLEALHNVTNFPMEPTGLDLRNALSSRNGLCFLLGKDSWVSGRHKPRVVNDAQIDWLQAKLAELYRLLLTEHPEIPTTYWNLETSLCAYKKLFFGTRYVGYYIDRQMTEIKKMQAAAPDGADWGLLWKFRREHFHPAALGEISGWEGIQNDRLGFFLRTGKFCETDMPTAAYR